MIRCAVIALALGLSSGASWSWGDTRDSGSILAWGDNANGQCNVPAPNMGFLAADGGGAHTLGLKEDGSILAWGDNEWGQCNVPSPNAGFIAVAAGNSHSLGLKDD